MPEATHKTQIDEFVSECFDRLQRRARMCQMVLVEITNNQPVFDILDEIVWEKIQFEVIAVSMIAKLKDARMKDTFLQEFRQYEDCCV